MIDLHYATTPNGWKATIALEEMELPYRVNFINLASGEQFEPEFLAISPNGRMPAIVDHEPQGGGAPVSVFESGAILIYLAEKAGKFLPSELRGRTEVIQWVMWQMAGLGPMMGQHAHFRQYTKEPVVYAVKRYHGEVQRLFGVLENRLEGREAICGEYSIADMACWPWVLTYKRQEIDLAEFPNVKRWHEFMKSRPGVRRGFDVGKEGRKFTEQAPSDEARENLFERNQSGG